jgi:multisubunit Na+/H+ antiporter MnhF subunit
MEREGTVGASPNPIASHHLPLFITAPGQTDVLLVVMTVVLVAAVLAFGVLFLRLHSLPERIAHRTHKLQFEIVAVLCLIALFTHVHWLWLAALLLAMVNFPDFSGIFGRIAGSVEKIAASHPGEVAPVAPHKIVASMPSEGTAAERRDAIATSHNGERPAVEKVPELAPSITRRS